MSWPNKWKQALVVGFASGKNPFSAGLRASGLFDDDAHLRQMRQFSQILRIDTAGRGFYEFTPAINGFARNARMETGLLTVFCQHTSASLLIQENADPSVLRDLEAVFARLAPEGPQYEHDAEGPDDMPAHVRAALTQTSLSIPLIGGRLALGTWQGVYLFEHRRRPHAREIALHIAGM